MKCCEWHQFGAPDPICDISAQFLLWCTEASFRNRVIMCGPKFEEGGAMRRRQFITLLGGVARAADVPGGQARRCGRRARARGSTARQDAGGTETEAA